MTSFIDVDDDSKTFRFEMQRFIFFKEHKMSIGFILLISLVRGAVSRVASLRMVPVWVFLTVPCSSFIDQGDVACLGLLRFSIILCILLTEIRVVRLLLQRSFLLV
eukprot:snap_masked-scaffold_26-processed-gene-1.37-mRNA-1 protein AED:1.00 eAED:1.00 QI:0/0/0/0/1/1/4/0/105